MHSFKHVNLLDEAEKNVIGAPFSINIKNTFYNEKEYADLDKSFRSFVFGGVQTEFEIVVEELVGHKKIKIMDSYTISIYDRKTGASTSFCGTVLKQERTHKKDLNKNICFYSGVRHKDSCYDGLLLFGNYTPKTFFALLRSKMTGFVVKIFSKKKENEIFDKYGSEYIFYNITEATSKIHKDFVEGIFYPVNQDLELQ